MTLLEMMGIEAEGEPALSETFVPLSLVEALVAETESLHHHVEDMMEAEDPGYFEGSRRDAMEILGKIKKLVEDMEREIPEYGFKNGGQQ